MASGQLSGSIQLPDGKPADYVSVAIQGTSRGTTTDERGQFQLRRLSPGSYTLVVSFVGYETQRLPVEVHAGEATQVPAIALVRSDQKLQEVVVNGSKPNPFARRQTDNVARMPIANLENAQVYNVITKELAQDQQAVEFRDILKNAPGVGGANTQNGLLGRSQLIIRGFSQIFTLKNGMQVSSNFAPDPVTIEKLDVIKGPSATLFGAAGFGMGYGGFVNQETKRPYDTRGGEVSYSGGSYGLNRITADVNLPLNDERTALFRLNAAGQMNNSFQHYGSDQTYTINPSFLYKASDKLTLRAEFDAQHNQRAGYGIINPVGSQVTARSWQDVRIDRRSTYGSDQLHTTIAYYDLFLQAEYRFSPSWKSQTNFMGSYFDTQMRILTSRLLTDSTLVRTGSYRPDIASRTTNIQQNFIGDFQLGRFRNRLLVGADFNSNVDAHQNLYGKTVTFDTINYRRFSEKLVTLDQFEAKTKSAGYDNYGGIYGSYIFGAYVSDVFNLTDNLLLSAGLRFDSYHDRTGVDFNGVGGYPDNNQNSFSPKFGLIYQPVLGKVSVFANYQNGFTNQFGTDATGKRFKPEHANQVEAGVKAELTRGLSGSVSLYDIRVKDVLRTDPNDVNFSVQDADQRNRGVEADLIFNPVPGLNLVAGYGFIDAEYTKADAEIQGKRPSDVARHLANFWASYRVRRGGAQGLGLGFGGNYTSDAYVDGPNTFVVPGYVLLDASVSYDQPRYRVGFKVNNLADAVAFTRYGAVSARQLVLNVAVKF